MSARGGPGGYNSAMTRRRLLLPVGVGLTALAAVVALAAHGRPLRGDRGGGPSGSFFDYAFTTILLIGAIVIVITVLALRQERHNIPYERRPWWLSLAIFLGLTLFTATVLPQIPFVKKRLRDVAQRIGAGNRRGRPLEGQPKKPPRSAAVRWDELAVAAALVALGGAWFLVARSRRGDAGLTILPEEPVTAQLADVLDDTLDDLRAERDPRRAIIASYARMEVALSAIGLPRHRAEAPLEYLERALLQLDTSAGAVRRLTDLFERAKFSPHEPEPRMKDDAIASLVAVRDELRAAA